VPEFPNPLKFTINFDVTLGADKPQRRVARQFNSLLAFGSGQPLHDVIPTNRRLR
jgi:hypothetical protein